MMSGKVGHGLRLPCNSLDYGAESLAAIDNPTMKQKQSTRYGLEKREQCVE
jgi:hypothetical protein